MNEQENLHKLEQSLHELMQTKQGRRAFLEGLPLLLAATSCARVTADRHREGNNDGQQTSITVQDEVQMTKEVLPKMKKDYPAYKNQEVQKYIKNLGNKVVRSNHLNARPYHYNFTVVDVDYVNAFALPAGTVFVTAPLIKMADSEAELAGVIGHEVGHIKARHAAERIDKAKKQEKKSWLYGAVGGILGGAAGFGVGKLLCAPKDKECLQRAALYGAAAGVGGTLLIQKYAFMANSREDEMEADRIGFRTSVASGYHKDHVGKFYEKLLAMHKKHEKSNSNQILKSLADAFSTHPPTNERVKQMNQMAAQEKHRSKMIINTTSFDRVKRILS